MDTVIDQHDPLAEGVVLFNAGEYWHAHEAWERGWLTSNEPQKTLYKGIIQAAAALVHSSLIWPVGLLPLGLEPKAL